MSDLIRVIDLRVGTYIGVSEEERAQPQLVLMSLELRLDTHRAARSDDVKMTVDYAAVAQRVQMIAEERPRRLIETLAEDIAARLLKLYLIDSVTIEIKKYVLPDAAYVSVVIERRQSSIPAIRL